LPTLKFEEKKENIIMANSANTKNPYLDATGLSQVWAAIIAAFVQQEAGKGLSTNDLTDALKKKLDEIAEGAQVNVIESVKVNGTALEITDKGVNVLVPTGALASLDKVGSDNLDTALAAVISGKANSATTLAGYGIADAYTKTETDNAIDTKVKTAVAGIYKVKGSVNFADLPTEGMSDGDTYNIKDAFTTTDAFEEGAGASYPAGTNVTYVEADKKWDCMAGTYDFSDYLTKDDVRSLTSDEIAAICKIGD
jgi:hypothetical protein